MMTTTITQITTTGSAARAGSPARSEFFGRVAAPLLLARFLAFPVGASLLLASWYPAQIGRAVESLMSSITKLAETSAMGTWAIRR